MIDLAEETIVVRMASALRGVDLNDAGSRAFAYATAGIKGPWAKIRIQDATAQRYERIRRAMVTKG